MVTDNKDENRVAGISNIVCYINPREVKQGNEESGRRDSNPRPLAWEANVLPTELLPLLFNKIMIFFLNFNT